MAGRKSEEKLYDITYLNEVLDANKDKRFVQRILNPGAELKNKDGSVSTHRMSYSSGDGIFYVYPTVVADDAGNLITLNKDEAWENAKSGESIPFENEADAKWFSKNYKKVWRGKK